MKKIGTILGLMTIFLTANVWALTLNSRGVAVPIESCGANIIAMESMHNSDLDVIKLETKSDCDVIVVSGETQGVSVIKFSDHTDTVITIKKHAKAAIQIAKKIGKEAYGETINLELLQ